MKWSSLQAADVALLAFFLLAPLPVTAQLDCKKILADKTKFDFSKLAGPHSVITTANTPPVITNTTYTVDLCAALKRKGDPAKTDRCPSDTRLCAISREKYDDQDKPNERPSKVIPIVEGGLNNGKEIEPKFTRLKTSASNADAKKEGVRLELHGGTYAGTKQRAIIEMLCKDEIEGTEGELPGDFEYESKEAVLERSLNILSMREAEDNDPPPTAGETQVKGSEDPALVWESYKLENDFQTVRLTWHTKYACEAYANSGDASSHWGFFTWFVVLVFLGTAAYLIFGSWLNYNRYGARGWDLLPHGDTIRDVPFLLKDWTRRLINTLQGSGSRGGYSAV